MRKVKFVGVALTLAVALGIMANSECDRNESTREGIRAQEQNMRRAVSQTAVPQMRNFLTRKTIAEWLKRQDVANRPSYIYVFTMGSRTPLGYFVAKSRPVNICTSITPPKREYSVMGSGPNPLGPAPALDGVYYAGSGCNQWYFFDAETNGLVELTTDIFGIFSSDVPLELNVDVPRLKGKVTFNEPKESPAPAVPKSQ